KDVDGDVYWIYGKLVSNKIRCAVVKVDKANVRRGPGTRYRKTDFSPAIKYDSFRILRRKGLWYKVKDEFGQVGWIHRKLLWVQ
ncbi:MAG: SH3 domain-containing protein, partial [Nitrospirae bacterium]